MNVLTEDVRSLLRNKKDMAKNVERMRSYVHSLLHHCDVLFPKYENTIQKSKELIQGLYNDDLAAELFIAPTQFGKTSTLFWTAYDLMTHVDMKYFVPYPFVFIMTGLNSNSWKDQTMSRVLPCMQDNVWHNKDISKKCNKERLKTAILSNYNTLIIIDEVHVGTKLDHVIFSTLLECHPEHQMRSIKQTELFEFLHQQHVKFLLVSATPDAIKETMEQHWPSDKYNTVVAYPDSAPSYIWHKDFLQHGRVKQSYRLLDNIKEDDRTPFYRVIAQNICEYPQPLYHMIRFPMETKNAEIEKSKDCLIQALKDLDVEVNIVHWDAENTLQDYFEKYQYKVFQKTTDNEDYDEEDEIGEVNDPSFEEMSNEMMLKQKPLKHTIFILKELFRVAQTMPIDNIGVLVDRYTTTHCDSTLSQSFIGRACGHNKHAFMDQIMIYTHVPSVINYIHLWKNHFDYTKVPGYKGNGLQTSKTGKVLKASATMMGKSVKRTITLEKRVKREKEIKEIEDNQEDTPERLARIAKAYKRENGIVRKIIQMFIENDFKPIQDLGVKNMVNYYRYTDDKHCHMRVVTKLNNSWVLRQEIKDYLNL